MKNSGTRAVTVVLTALLTSLPSQAMAQTTHVGVDTRSSSSTSVEESDGVAGARAPEARTTIAPVETTETTDTSRSTTYRVDEIVVEVVEVAVQPAPDDFSVRFDINTQFLPRFVHVYLNRTDQQALAAGGISALNVALCAIPPVGWVMCGAITASLQSAGEYLKAQGLCQKNFRITFDFNSGPDNWMTFGCD